jgi:fumigallin biosynthesis monooxygenase-like protein
LSQRANDRRPEVTSKVQRQTVDLSAFPDLVVIYLGMRVTAWTGVRTMLGLGPQITNSVGQKPDGLLLHEEFIMSVIPLHLGMRQYWRDFEALEAWSRSEPHRVWWQDFLRSSRGTGFWHEAYFMRGGIEAVYDDMPVRLGLGQFAPLQPARGPLFSARHRAKLAGEPRPAIVREAEFYGTDDP